MWKANITNMKLKYVIRMKLETSSQLIEEKNVFCTICTICASKLKPASIINIKQLKITPIYHKV